MQNTTKKFKDWIIIWLWFIFILGLSWLAYASFSWIVPSTVTTWATLTASGWNEIVNNQNYLKQEIDTLTSTGSWPTWNYCILRSWWSCPAWFSIASWHVRAFAWHTAHNSTYYSNTTIWDSILWTHGWTGYPYGSLADVILYGCCK